MTSFFFPDELWAFHVLGSATGGGPRGHTILSDGLGFSFQVSRLCWELTISPNNRQLESYNVIQSSNYSDYRITVVEELSPAIPFPSNAIKSSGCTIYICISFMLLSPELHQLRQLRAGLGSAMCYFALPGQALGS